MSLFETFLLKENLIYLKLKHKFSMLIVFYTKIKN